MSQESDQSSAVDVTCPGCFHPQTWDAAAACPICHFRGSAAGRSAALLPVGIQLKNYIVGEKLGQGGFGITYRGFDVTLKMKVAIKEYYPSEMVGRATDHKTVVLNAKNHEDSFHYCREAFLKEAQTIAQIRHPHIVRVLNFFEMNDTAYLVMDFYQGEDLDSHLKLNRKDRFSRRLPWREAVTLLLPVLDGLQRVHAAGFMHRDIKPGNLYLTEDGLILLDFGSARQVTGTHTSSMLIFSAGFSPYEQYIEGQLNRQGSWTDVYALAATLYVMVTGHRLPSGLDRIQAQLRNQPDLLKPARFFVPEVPTALDAVLSRALAVEPDERTPSVGMLKRELQVVLAEVEPPPVVPPLSAKTEGAATTVVKPPLSPKKPAPIEVNPPVELPPAERRGIEFVRHWAPIEVNPPVELPPPVPTEEKPPVQSPPQPAPPHKPRFVWLKWVFFGLLSMSLVGAGLYWTEKQRRQLKAEARPLAGPMVRITGGCFQMGSPANEPDRDNDERQHRVCVKDFEMGSYEVTQAQWQAVMSNNPSRFENCANCPVEQVSWNDVQDYLARLNQKTGNTYRLPTEAEWEYACRGGVAGERYCGGNDVDRLAWHGDNSGSKTHPVGQKAANGFSLYDMSGNVWEWICSAYDQEYGGVEQKCTNNYTDGSLALRGGSWYSIPAWVRSADRDGSAPAYRNSLTGFRLARSL